MLTFFVSIKWNKSRSAEVPIFSNTFKADKEVNNIELNLELFMWDVGKEVRSESLQEKTHDDLFISRWMLRANVKISLELNNISY